MNIRVLGAFGSEGPGQRPSAFLVNDRTLVDAGSVSGGLTHAEQIAIEHVLLTHAHLDHVVGAAFTPDNRRLLLLHGDDKSNTTGPYQARLIDAATGQTLTGPWAVPCLLLYAAALSANGKRAATVALENEPAVQLWDAEAGKPTVRLPLNRDDSYQMFEYSCHEGNYALPNALSFGRKRDREAGNSR